MPQISRVDWPPLGTDLAFLSPVKQLRLISLCFGLITLLTMIGCGDSSPSSPKDLVQNDFEALTHLDFASLKSYDAANDGVITKIFGGPGVENIQQYLNDRIHLYALENEIELSPTNFAITDWTKDPQHEENLKAANAQVGAANISTAYWFMGLVNETPVVFTINKQKIPVNSSRTGVILLGDGYKEEYPELLRQSMLIHEARHSDCTGGLSKADLKKVALATSSRNFSETFPRLSCGHLHVYCPAGHDYQNLPACDREAWGAYGIDATFAAAAYSSASSNPKNWEIAQIMAIDSKSRLLVPVSGSPDMSSTDTVTP